jgi:hypothetical protein
METIIGIASAVLFVWLMWGSIPGGRVPERQDRFAASGGRATVRRRASLKAQP